jgi:2-polyprenyl-3-methyl-5-hydroxy-6-metoxy-1,4-benzoquinol methylase
MAMVASDWDKRFDREDYLFGTEPTGFLADHAGFFLPGARVLSVAEGEGRNAVWLAGRGCKVTGFDGSKVALEKAQQLAASRGVEVDLRYGDIATWDWTAAEYDVVLASYIQFCAPDLRAQVFEGLKTALAPGGRLMLSGYTLKQLEYGTGGPGNPDLLYTREMLAEAFADMRILRLSEYEQDLSEGIGHAGRSALIDLIAERR